MGTMPPGAGHKTFVQLLDQRINKYVRDAQPLPGVVQPISIPYLVHGGDPSTTTGTGTGTGTTTVNPFGLLPLTVGPLPPFLIDFPFQITGCVLASPNSTDVTDPATGAVTTQVGGQVTIDIGTAAIRPTTLPSGYVMSVFPFFFSATGTTVVFGYTTDPTTGILTPTETIVPGPNTPQLNGAIVTIPDPYFQDLTTGSPTAPLLPEDWLVQWPAFTWVQYSILAVDGVMTDLTIHLRVLPLGQQ
jgi:hypothetical protein